MSILLKNCEYVVTQNKDREILRNVDIGIENNEIKEIVSETKKSYERKIDCSNKVILPGLINTHTHAGMSIMRGYSDDKELFPWLEDMWEIENQLTPKEVRIGTALSIIEMLKTGTTSFLDMYFALDEVPELIEEIGIRGYVGWGVFDPDKTTQKGNPIDNAEKFIRNNKDKELFNPHIAPHAVYTCGDEQYIKSKEIADKYDVLLHTHAAETRKEVSDCKKETDKRVIEYLDSLNVLDENTVLAHVGWVTKREAELIGNNKSMISHCPTSNMKLATGGVSPLPEFEEFNVPISIGSDGAVSNNSLNLFESGKIASLLQKHSRWDASLFSAQRILDFLTRSPGSFLKEDTGKLIPGATADLITIDLNRPGNRPVYNIVSNLVYSTSLSTTICDSLINGKIVVKNGGVKTVDEKEIIRKASELSSELVNNQ